MKKFLAIIIFLAGNRSLGMQPPPPQSLSPRAHQQTVAAQTHTDNNPIAKRSCGKSCCVLGDCSPASWVLTTFCFCLKPCTK